MRFVPGLAALVALGACNALFGVDELTYVATGGRAGHGGAGDGGAGIGGSDIGGSTNDVGGAGAGGHATGGGGGCTPDSEAFYLIMHTQEDSLAIDGSCGDVAWEDVPTILFEGSNNTDNAMNCRMMWREADNQLFGCCEFSDTELEANVTEPDHPATTEDDAFSYYLVNDSASPRPKVTINANGAVADAFYAAPLPDFSYDASVSPSVVLNGVLNESVAGDMSWTVEWRATIAHDATPGQAVFCNFQMTDRDNGITRYAVAFPEPSTSFDDPGGFGKCQLACQSAP